MVCQRWLTADKPEQFVLLDGSVEADYVSKSLLNGLPGEERLTSHHFPTLADQRG